MDKRTRVGAGLGWAKLTSLADCRGLAAKGAAAPTPGQAGLQQPTAPCWARPCAPMCLPHLILHLLSGQCLLVNNEETEARGADLLGGILIASKGQSWDMGLGLLDAKT